MAMEKKKKKINYFCREIYYFIFQNSELAWSYFELVWSSFAFESIYIYYVLELFETLEYLVPRSRKFTDICIDVFCVKPRGGGGCITMITDTHSTSRSCLN